MPSLSKAARLLLAAILAYVAYLVYLGLTLSEDQFKETFSEAGFFEEFSIVAWGFAAVTALVSIRKRFSPSLLLSHGCHAVLFLMCAMREADWHKKFTSDGILKLRYYTTSNASLWEKIPAAIVSAMFIGLMAHALYRCYQYAKIRTRLRLESTCIMLSGIMLFFVGKVLDRSISVMTESFHWAISSALKQSIAAQEEGLEMLTPILIAIAFIWPDSKTSKSD